MEVPTSWSQVATDILAQKYFRKAGVPVLDEQGQPMLDGQGNVVTGSEKSARQVVRRMTMCWRWWGEQYGYFASPEDAQAYQDEMAYFLIHQMSAPNSRSGSTPACTRPTASLADRRGTTTSSPKLAKW